ncbi:MAG: hypothetical protein HY401_01125 [Elusimicrobia bacterium]|nr:hypothetical protein [Elusimicrobiota bacterium]
MILLLSELVLKPSAFFARAKNELPRWGFGWAIYGLSLIAASLFYALKPEGFPKDSFSSAAGSHSIGFWLMMSLLGVILTLLTALVVSALIRFQEGSWKIGFPKTFYVLMVCHIWYLILFVLLSLASAARSEPLYKIFEISISFIGFFFTIWALKMTARTTIAKVFVSLLLSSLGLMAGLFTLYLTGIIPTEILKVLLFI